MALLSLDKLYKLNHVKWPIDHFFDVQNDDPMWLNMIPHSLSLSFPFYEIRVMTLMVRIKLITKWAASEHPGQPMSIA